MKSRPNEGQTNLSRQLWSKKVAAVLAVVVLALVVILPVNSAMRAPVSPQDEGLLLVYPTLVIHGGVANKSFESAYGQATYWTIAAAYAIAGSSVTVERSVGLLYELILVTSLVALVSRRRGLIVGCLAGLFPAILEVNIGLSALAWMGALALASLGLVLVDSILCSSHLNQRCQLGLLFAAGVCFGLSISYRLDFAFPVTLLFIPLVITRNRDATRLIPGMVIGLVPLIVNIFQAGPSAVLRGEFFQPVFTIHAGRYLPIGSVSRSLLFTTGFAMAGAFVVAFVGYLIWRQESHSKNKLTLIMVGLFDFGLLPQALQRMDVLHVDLISGFIFASLLLIPLAINWLFVLGVLLLMSFNLRAYSGAVFQSLGFRPDPEYVVSNEGRSVTVQSARYQNDLNKLLHSVDVRSHKGERIFVGPSDMRRTNLNDTFLYFLFPTLMPGSYYLEMEPGVANAANSHLVTDVAHSQLLILTTRYNNWQEPNSSSVYGSSSADDVVATRFKMVGKWGPWSLLRRKSQM